MKRSIVVVASLVLAACIYVVTFGFWYGANVEDEETFTDHALASFALEGSYPALGEIVADKVVAEYPGLALFGSSLATLFGALLATPPFEPALEALARDVHDRLFEDTQAALIVDLADYREEVVAGLSAFAPGVVELVPDDAFREYVLFDEAQIPGVEEESQRLDRFMLGAVIVGAFALTSIVFAASSASAASVAIGGSMLGAGAATWLLTPMTRDTLRVAIRDEDYRVVVLNLFDTVTSDVTTLVVVLVGGGLLLVAAGLAGLLMRKRSAEATPQPLDG